jgi:hypothetical protein
MKIRIFCLIVLSCCFIYVQQVFAETSLEFNDILDSQIGENVEFNLKINNAPNEVGALGFEIVYNPNILSYQSYELGQGFKDRFDIFYGNKKKDGMLIFAGIIADQKIQQGESGLLLTVSFTVLKSDRDTVTLQNLKDHFTGWSVKNGLFNQKTLGYEDINNDGNIGLAEVVHLLQIVSGFNSRNH